MDLLASTGDFGHLNIILLLGLAVLGGTLGAKIFQRFHIPQVVGYIVIGVLVGRSVLNLVNQNIIESLRPFNMFALGLIGFTIGGELRLDIFRKYGKQFITILLAEGFSAFAVVSLLSTVVAQILLADWTLSVSLGVLLGAIASATAPAATVDVLWEYKTRGPLTRTVLAIVALDDGLALILFGFAASAAELLTGHSTRGLWMNLALPIWDIAGAIVIGILTGLFLVFVLKYVTEPDKMLSFTLASVLLIIGLSIALQVDSILAAMALGATIANCLPRRSHSTFDLVAKFVPPIYVLFFVLVGARLHLTAMPIWVVVLAIVYVLGRSGGKILGAWIGARISHAQTAIRKYLGLCLFSQAGVAVGLSIVAGQRFEGIELGDGFAVGEAIILIVTTTTFLVQIIGPPCVKYAAKRAGEIGMNVTEEDLMKTYRVRDVMDREVMTIGQDLPLNSILDAFSRSNTLYYPVLGPKGRLAGTITIAGIKDTLLYQGQAGWLLACDLMEPVQDQTTPDTALDDAISYMEKYQIEYMPVVEAEDGGQLVGLLDLRAVHRRLGAEVLERRKRTD